MRWFTPDNTPVHGFLGKRELLREDGRIEQLCEHGVGHPIGVAGRLWRPVDGVHGCCGCCRTAAFHLEHTRRETALRVVETPTTNEED